MGDAMTMTVTETKRFRSPHQPVGRWIRADKRLAIYLRDGMRCLYCLADLHGADPRDVTLDHLVARSDGGSNRESNLCTACRQCNSTRQDTPLSQFAGRATRAHIRRNARRVLAPYLRMARAIMAGELEYDRAEEGDNE
jgi:5-methylcytosine-specific restriction endonuclease McrA